MSLIKLKFYRFMESIFSIPSAYFGDLADSIDIELHERLKIAMKDIKYKHIVGYVSGHVDVVECPKCGAACTKKDN